MKSEFAGQPGEWAYAESPLVDGDLVVVTPGGAEATKWRSTKRRALWFGNRQSRVATPRVMHRRLLSKVAVVNNMCSA